MTDFLWVAMHEFGHAIGLNHITTDRAAIMFPVYPTKGTLLQRPHLGTSDITCLQQLYGGC